MGTQSLEDNLSASDIKTEVKSGVQDLDDEVSNIQKQKLNVFPNRRKTSKQEKHNAGKRHLNYGRKFKTTLEANFQCEHCNYLTTNKYNLDRHNKYVHEKIKKFSCNHCKY